MQNYRDVYDSLTGGLAEEYRIDGVEDISAEGTPYSGAYQAIWDARESLCRRYGMDFEDRDLERIMQAVLTIEEEIARYMFHYGMKFTATETE